jgi:hypothetical protein
MRGLHFNGNRNLRKIGEPSMTLFFNLFRKRGKISRQSVPLPPPGADQTTLGDTPAPTPRPTVKIGALSYSPGDTILSTYRIEDIITTGGMGLILVTTHQGWKIKVAIKIPTEEVLSLPYYAQRVVKEAEAWTALGLHPNIAYCYFVRNIENIP